MARKYRNLKPKICPACKQEFKPRTYKSVYCSQRCQWDAKKVPKATPKTKTCSNCGKRRKSSQFQKSNIASDGLQSWCRACMKQRDRTVRIEYNCEDCGKSLVRTTPRHGKKVFDRQLCNKCVRHAVMAANGGRPANWTGSEFIPGKLLAAWKHGAKQRGYEWSLTKADLDSKFQEQGGTCALSGIEMVHDKSSPFRPSIDRIDPTKGYTRSNFQFVCSAINVMKNKFSEELFIRLCENVAEYQS